MDPYLQNHWGDVHSRLVIYTSDQLRKQLPGDLRARVEERVFVETDLVETDRSIYPDVSITEERRGDGTALLALKDVDLIDPYLFINADEPETQTFIEIIDVGSGGRVVTAIEFLGPANKKPGIGRDLYLYKQHQLRGGRVSSVEIDLIYGGVRTFTVPDDRIPETHRHIHSACIRRGWQAGGYAFYAFPLSQRLPKLPIPLRRTDHEAALDLQALIDQCYENGGYDTINYRADPIGPLPPSDAGWVDGLLKGRQRR